MTVTRGERALAQRCRTCWYVQWEGVLLYLSSYLASEQTIFLSCVATVQAKATVGGYKTHMRSKRATRFPQSSIGNSSSPRPVPAWQQNAAKSAVGHISF